MAKALRTIAVVAGAVALIATGIGAIGGATFAATALGGTIATIGTWAGVIAGVAGIGAQLLTKPPPARGSVTETIIDVNPPSPYGMGEGYFGGVLRHKVGYGPTLKKVPNPFLFEAVALCVAGPIAGPIVPQVDFGPVTGYYSGWLATDTRLGQRPDTALTAPLQANPTGWSTNHRLSGVAAIAWNHKFDKDGKVYASGLPTRGVVAKWALCYDPRKDSTRPGGSGPHRLGVESTYEWSENPALHAGTYAFGRYVNGKRVIGVGLPDEGIDWEGVAAWANDCQANGWRMFGFVFEGTEDDAQRRWQNLRDICIAGGAEPLFSGAVLGFHWQRPRVPLDTVTEADLADGPQEVTAMKSWRDRLNTVRPRYTSPAHNWSLVQAQQVQVTSYLAEDGEERAEDIPFNFVKDVNQAAQLAAYWLTNSRELTPITLTLMPRLRHYRPGECLRLQLPELGLDHDAVILRREFDPASMTVTLTLVTEDPAKHAFALGRTGVAPPTPSLTNSAEDRDTITREARAPYWPEVDGPGRPEDSATRNEDGGGNLVGAAVTLAGTDFTNSAVLTTVNGQPAAALVGAAFSSAVFGSFFPVRGGERLWWSYTAHTDVSTADILQAGVTWSDAAGNFFSENLADLAMLGNSAVGLGNTRTVGAWAQVPVGAVSARFYAIRPTWGGVGTWFVRKPFVSRSQPGATEGAPAGTNVAGVEASALTTQAAQAQTNAAAAVLAISNITADNILSADEKPEIRKQRDAILDEYPKIRAQALAANVAVATFDARYTDLTSYLAGLDLGGATNTAITRATFNTRFTDYFAARQTVLDGIAARGIGAFTAKHNLLFNGRFRLGLNGWDNVVGTWRFVRDNRGQFVEQPLGTGGTFVLRSNRPINVAAGQQVILSVQAFALAASAGEFTRADIEWRNGTNNTVLGFSSDTLDGANINSNFAVNQPGYRSQPLTAPNPTDGSGFVRAFVRIVSTGTLAYQSGWRGILGVKVEAGSTPSAISDEATDGAVLDNTFGRIRNPRAYNTQAILGPRNVSTLVPTYTVGASNVTVNLPAHSRVIASESGPQTLSYGAASGVVPFSSYWTAYIDDPELTGFASPAVVFTTNPNDLLFPNRYQIASGYSPNASGTGGGSGGGGGGVGPPPRNPGDPYLP